ncbi:MAG TPA: glutamine--fructose-6-phosphate aminotransferase, partial [Flavobacteriaceae bacterium]|nr:glutamine--fructose-6-phosphate aminotransferase [Flavobacteriaceae bacterium]
MCGIVGYLGSKNAYPIILKGLKRLEYRGYDSSGICLYNGNKLISSKAKGKISKLEKRTSKLKTFHGNIGIGHTRWATHGEPNDINAHPHSSNSNQIHIV